MRLSKRLIVVDPMCRRHFGHQISLNKAIREWGEDKGYEVVVLVRHNAEPSVLKELSAIPALSFGEQRELSEDLETTQAIFDEENALSRSELSSVITELSEDDMVVMHTTTNFGLEGVADWLESSAPGGCKIRHLLRFEPDYNNRVPDWKEPIRNAFMNVCANALRRMSADSFDSCFFVDSRELRSRYEELTHLEYRLVPLSINFGDFIPYPPPERSDRNEIRFLLPGLARPEKGINILPRAIDLFWERGGMGQFAIHFFANENRRQKFEEKHPHISVHGKPIMGDPFLEFLSQSDVILLPYDNHNYRERTSHILIEALGCGRPVITTSGTPLESEIRSLNADCAIFMKSYSSEGLADALLEFVKSPKKVSQAAWGVSATMRSKHNIHSLIDVFLE